MDYFNQQDKFVAYMADAYKIGKLGAVSRPYIQWKTCGPLFSKEQAYAMMNTASDLLGKMFELQKPMKNCVLILRASTVR